MFHPPPIHDTNSIALAVHAPVGVEVPKRSADAGVGQLNPRHLTWGVHSLQGFPATFHGWRIMCHPWFMSMIRKYSLVLSTIQIQVDKH